MSAELDEWGRMYSGLPFYLVNDLRDGEVFLTVDVASPSAQCVLIGTRPLTYVERTIRDIAIDVFGEEFLRQIKAWQPTSEEILSGLRSRAAS